MELLEYEEIMNLSKIYDPYIYFLLKEEQIVYIGKTEHCMRSRLKNHQYSGKKFDDFRILKVEKDEIFQTEKAYIEKYKPIYNVHGVIKKPLYIKKKDRILN